MPLAVVGPGALPLGLCLAFVAGLPLGVLALCGATVQTIMAGASFLAVVLVGCR